MHTCCNLPDPVRLMSLLGEPGAAAAVTSRTSAEVQQNCQYKSCTWSRSLQQLEWLAAACRPYMPHSSPSETVLCWLPMPEREAGPATSPLHTQHRPMHSDPWRGRCERFSALPNALPPNAKAVAAAACRKGHGEHAPVQCAAVSTGVIRVAHVLPQGCHNLGASPGILPARLSVARCGAGCAGAAGGGLCAHPLCAGAARRGLCAHPRAPHRLRGVPPPDASLPPLLHQQSSMDCVFKTPPCCIRTASVARFETPAVPVTKRSSIIKNIRRRHHLTGCIGAGCLLLLL